MRDALGYVSAPGELLLAGFELWQRLTNGGGRLYVVYDSAGMNIHELCQELRRAGVRLLSRGICANLQETYPYIVVQRRDAGRARAWFDERKVDAR